MLLYSKWWNSLPCTRIETHDAAGVTDGIVGVDADDGFCAIWFLQGLPSSLLLENSENDRFLLLPSATLPGRPESKVPQDPATVPLSRFSYK